MTHVLGRLRRALGCWAWTPLLVKGLGWLCAFGALAHVGQGTAARLLRPPMPPAVTLGIATMVEASSAPTRKSLVARPCAESETPRGAARLPDGRVILNQAGIDDLVRLPGIGRKRAESIVALRRKLGRFQSLRQLLRIRGIGWRSLKRLAPLLVLDPPPAPASSAGGSPAKSPRGRKR